ncbi:MAG: hypothetical protein SF182_02505 [Deltaproteobacteria bacterium]|nr:hypothetical protein [Deltaproteobacteria bacterium]
MSATADRDYRRRARFGRFAFRLVRSAGRKRQTWLDRLLTRLLRRATNPKPGADFMRDELVDAGIGFDPDELARYEQSEPRGPARP